MDDVLFDDLFPTPEPRRTGVRWRPVLVSLLLVVSIVAAGVAGWGLWQRHVRDLEDRLVAAAELADTLILAQESLLELRSGVEQLSEGEARDDALVVEADLTEVINEGLGLCGTVFECVETTAEFNGVEYVVFDVELPEGTRVSVKADELHFLISGLSDQMGQVQEVLGDGGEASLEGDDSSEVKESFFGAVQKHSDMVVSALVLADEYEGLVADPQSVDNLRALAQQANEILQLTAQEGLDDAAWGRAENQLESLVQQITEAEAVVKNSGLAFQSANEPQTASD